MPKNFLRFAILPFSFLTLPLSLRLTSSLLHPSKAHSTTMAATITNAKAPIRVALLVCGTPIPAVAELHGEYPAIFNNLLQDGLKELKERKTVGPDTELVLEGFDVREGLYPEHLSDYDGVLISGSGRCFVIHRLSSRELQFALATMAYTPALFHWTL
jgi:hypothetical protein